MNAKGRARNTRAQAIPPALRVVSRAGKDWPEAKASGGARDEKE
jgi:hypothetical protein